VFAQSRIALQGTTSQSEASAATRMLRVEIAFIDVSI
jgi:hypothetical protein